MKNFKALVITAAAMAFIVAPAAIAQSSSTDSATANATIIAAIQLSNAASLEFGDIVQDTAAGTVTVDTAGAATTSGLTHLGGESAAGFDVTGDSSKTFAVTLPANGTVSLAGPGPAMGVNSFTSSCSATCALTGGSGSFTVGATLSVAANQTAGSYTGTFDVTVAYE